MVSSNGLGYRRSALPSQPTKKPPEFAMSDIPLLISYVLATWLSILTPGPAILLDNQTIQKQQQADYQHLADYLKEAEMSSAKFWVACNQTMQKYVEAAAQGMEPACQP